MFPGRFDYHRPSTVSEAVRLLGERGEEARLLAGGHSLIPMMKLRMAAPSDLIDLGGVAALRGVRVEGGTVRIGAMATQADLIADAALAEAAPLVREAALQIADPQVRYVGTIGGNVANGDPGNDMPGLMQCLDATFTLVGPDGERQVRAREFYFGAYDTARADDEILTEVSFPAHAGRGWAYEKQKRKIGDYATAAAAVLLRMDGGRCAEASVALTNLADRPVFSAGAATALEGSTLDEAALSAAVAAMQADIEPASDNRGPAEFKRHVAGVMLRRAVARAAARA
ncbi:MAG: xanthine dehydrogenase family protein subunit M [Rhodobacteraceae bacterium]|nr:MAG: xanthine dehydrogenase family protein subunit M [Paracoccaceae bacterium]